MKLILDLDENVIKNMQGYCDQQDMTINELIERLFTQYIQDPANIIDGVYERNGSLKPLEDFSEMMTHYLNEAIFDIEQSAKSDEAYKTDFPMIEVFKALNRDIIPTAFVLTTLYKAYEDVTKNE